MTTGIVELDDLAVDPNPLESTGKYTRYGIDPADQDTFSLGEAEWFCTECGEVVEDPGEPCWCGE